MVELSEKPGLLLGNVSQGPLSR